MTKKIRIVPDCGHDAVGHWENKVEKGSICWMFDTGKPAVEVDWPKKLTCRYCQRVFKSSEVQKKWHSPVYYSHVHKTFNCGCVAIDSSD